MRNIRIGVVEDDPASCQLVLDYLNRYQQENGEQFTVSVFDDGARIVEKYAPVYDILLLDIEMKEMDGMAAARRIRERDDNVVIIFITAAPQYAISGYEVRALSYLLKPLPWFAFSQELKKSIDMVRRNAALAGVPKEVIKRARQKLRELESISPNAAATQVDGTQMSLLAAPEETSPAVEALENLDPDSLTPRQALEWIYRLKSLV